MASGPPPRKSGGKRWRRVRLVLLSVGLVIALMLALLEILVRVVPFDADSLFPSGTGTLVLDRNGRPLRAYLAYDDRWRLPARLSTLSPYVAQATLAAEDRRFYTHVGIDPLSVLRAMAGNVASGRIVSGASTITMQVVGLEDKPPRTYLRKIRQSLRALQIERVKTKNQILELYLTHAPYGGNVQGIEAAARRWLGKSASDLTLAEAALLAGLPQSPSRLRPDRHPAAAWARATEVLRRMREFGMITPEQMQAALRQPIHLNPPGATTWPREAPHFSDMVRARAGRPGIIRSTLDREMQRIAERAVAARARELAASGVRQGAAVVLDVVSGQVLALVGSVKYDDRGNHGEVNGAVARRPAGSTLKPLIYALAYDAGQILPSARLPDVPTAFGAYAPENSDHKFRGLVAADEALAWSLNLPAFEVLRRIGPERALDALRQAGLSTLRESAGRYGLSLAVGTGSVRLLDLANAQAALARGGVWLPYRLRMRERAGDQPTTRIVSAEAAYLVNRALADTDLRPPEELAASLSGLEGVAWKTGTSNGRRDAWTVAWNDRYVTAVWFGNFDNAPSAALTGMNAAAPVALGIMKELRQATASRPSPRWPAEPTAGADAGFTTGVICKESGLVANEVCPTTTTLALIPVQGLKPVCSVHRRVELDAQTTTLLCSRCAPGRERTSVVRAFWPTAVAAWNVRQGITAGMPEQHFAGCPAQPVRPGPVILSPKDGETFLLDPTRGLSVQKIALKAAGRGEVFWFLDGTLVGASLPGDRDGTGPRIPMVAGSHRVRAVDGQGGATEIKFTVSAQEE